MEEGDEVLLNESSTGPKSDDVDGVDETNSVEKKFSWVNLGSKPL